MPCIIILYINNKIPANIYKYTNPYINVTFGLCGNCYLITPTSAIYAIYNTDKLLSRLLKALSWKYIPNIMTESNHNGKKMVIIATTGFLYNGILKCA